MSSITRKALCNYNNEFIPLSTSHPNLADDWDYVKNGDLSPDDVYAESNQRVWWRCSKCGREWQERIKRRAVEGRGCAGCSGQVCVPGFNDVATVNPDILSEWDYELNDAIGLYPYNITKGSHVMVSWKCQFGHRWRAEMNNRSKGQGCPFCSRRKVLVGFSDLATTHPELAKEWDYVLNGELKPEMVMAGSGKKVWWKCGVCNNSYEAQLTHRTQHKATGCPVCSGRKTIVGHNDLATTHPLIAKEWHPTLNGDLKPTDLVAGSFVKVWWQCPVCDCEWQAKPSHRTPEYDSTGCPRCSQRSRSSFPEQTIFYYVHKAFPDAIPCHRPDWLHGKELDIYIPSLNVGIEYDGQRYHVSLERDLSKSQICAENNVRLLRFREENCPTMDGNDIFIVKPNNRTQLLMYIADMLKMLGVSMDIDPSEFTKKDWLLNKTASS